MRVTLVATAAADIPVDALAVPVATGQRLSGSTLDLDRANTSVLVSNLINNILRASDRSRTIQPTEANKDSSAQKKEGELLHSRIRWSILTLALVLNAQLWRKSSSQTWSSRLFKRKKSQTQEDDAMKQTCEDLLFLYRDFALLELRIQGELPAWEGILLMKERTGISE